MVKKFTSIKPLFNRIVTTMNKYEEDTISPSGVIIPNKGSVMEYQTVVAVGSSVRDIKVGDLVYINPTRYAKMKHKQGSLKDGILGDNPVVCYEFSTVILEGKLHLLLYDSDVDFIIEDSYDEPDPIIQLFDKKIIK